MRLFIFESNTNSGLRAFAGDVAGRKLPDQFSPWRQIGAVRPETAPPYNLSRDTIEAAINAHGFQLDSQSLILLPYVERDPNGPAVRLRL